MYTKPVTVGSAVRLRARIVDVTEKKPGHLLVASEAVVEIRGVEKPALVAETLLMYVLGQGA